MLARHINYYSNSVLKRCKEIERLRIRLNRCHCPEDRENSDRAASGAYITDPPIGRSVLYDEGEVRDKIRQTILLTYLKDTVLPRTIEDSTLNTLSTMIYFNQVDIVTKLHQDPQYITELFAKIEQAERSVFSDAVKLLQELCNMAKNLQAQPRTAFYQVVLEAGLTSGSCRSFLTKICSE